jgi:hypothetical protein
MFLTLKIDPLLPWPIWPRGERNNLTVYYQHVFKKKEMASLQIYD